MVVDRNTGADQSRFASWEDWSAIHSRVRDKLVADKKSTDPNIRNHAAAGISALKTVELEMDNVVLNFDKVKAHYAESTATSIISKINRHIATCDCGNLGFVSLRKLERHLDDRYSGEIRARVFILVEGPARDVTGRSAAPFSTARSLSTLAFATALGRGRAVAILQTALPELHSYLEEIERLVTRGGLFRAILYDPASIAANLRNEQIGVHFGREYLQRRIWINLEDLYARFSDRVNEPSGQVLVRLTAEQLPYVFYGTNAEAWLGWLWLDAQSNNGMQLHATETDPLFHVWMHHFESRWKAAQPVRWDEVQAHSNRNLKAQSEYLPFELHVEIPVGKDLLAQLPRSAKWQHRYIEETRSGSARSTRGHSLPGGVGSIATYRTGDSMAVLEVMRAVGDAFNASDGVQIELEEVLYRSDATEPDDDFRHPTLPSPSAAILKKLEKLTDAPPYENHFTLMRSPGVREPLSIDEVVELAASCELDFLEVSVSADGERAIFTTFCDSLEELKRQTLRSRAALIEGIEKRQASVTLRTVAEAVVWCGRPGREGARGRP